MLIGTHLDLADVVEQAAKLGATAAQVFLGDPQSWKPPALEGADSLRERAEAAGLALYVHAPYVINVASTNNRIRIPSRKLLQSVVDGAATIGARGVVVHGGHVTAADDPGKGFDNWRKAIESLATTVPVLIENTAGGDHAMARRLDAIERLWAAVSPAGDGAVGFCLDTCHAWAGGLDLATVVDDVRAITGRIDLVHLNNSRDAASSGADRHAGLVAGRIDPGALLSVARAADVPVICETHDDAPADVAWLHDRLRS